LSNNTSILQVTAKEDSIVGFLPRLAVEDIVQRNPAVFLRFSKMIDSCLPDSLKMVDIAFDWMQVPPGEVLYENGDKR
jgi:lysophospholipid hydrolase